MLFNQGAHITKDVIQWGPAKKDVKFEIVKNSLKIQYLKYYYNILKPKRFCWLS